MRGQVIALILIGALSLSFTESTPKGEYLQKGHYIVVAAYRIGQEKYMENYVAQLNNKGLHSKYGYDAGRKFYYVYLDFYADFDESIEQMLKTRKEGGFDQAWVRVMKENVNVPSEAAALKPKETQTNTDSNTSVLTVSEPKPVEPNEAVVEEKQPEVEKPNIETKPKGITPFKEATVIFYLFNPTNSQPIEGDVEIVDSDVSRLIKKVKAHEAIPMVDLKNKTGKVTLIGSAFGFRKVQHDFSLSEIKPDNLPEYIEWKEDKYIVQFDLSRLHRGDIETLYNVYFFNDAAVMLPESKYELNRLLEFMNSNERYKIMLHGHTNGNARGKIVTMGPSKNFFELTQDVVDGSGSAKELSEARAQVIKDWLVSNGIAANRISIKAWGGNRMLHDKNSNNARRNVRVEVEVLED
ncbi:MAG TPA: OmpA family protein [Cyclobacteriaceae bacterium]|jgi:outer membrane protein OmpA-like peptidoglycan-associated protein|nr:OmpA family protein [Cytophagales bacterium]HNT49599.1 OmpA family protein [Cyclobacteriaceae bacterium]HRE66548.1 OmpA family protein [Cyclobacteriaceae bacterium]HRF31918.1 OmpA family protein [Cyclobacteriaceae bacterium]